MNSLTASRRKLLQSGGGDTDAQVPATRQQEGEESMRGVGVDIHNAGSVVDAAFMVGGISSCYRDTYDLLSCSQHQWGDSW